ncbi:adenosine kinase [Leptolyngbya cf. ectocarpi LEGE 11479]|uniref:Adenosine kinase n=1 Tax=Leptolyngbya cf. ectocarpi LEGE 11479 TaxID=1828722 RepID=A0A929F9S9_LEPEC|nr:adenosine kinase [Leptolyngbya ectocarpi]MBE9070010.1 adenosine kinase [Leptolyngbya cf. ectocarpi LEGE 11479]
MTSNPPQYNAQYNVYGLGNALVDIECALSVDTLASIGMDKGVMTLLDEAVQNHAIAQLKDYATKRSCGGSAANTLIAISQLGGKTFYGCKVADDEYGKFYTQDLVDCGVDTNLTSHAPESGITGKCLVLVTPDADRTMGTFLGISSQLSEADLNPDAIAAAEYTYLEGFLVSGDASRQAAIKAGKLAKAAGRKVALSLSDYNMVKFFKSGLLEMIGDGVDMLFANESEALLMADTDDIVKAIDHTKTYAKAFAITRGAQGSIIFDGQQVTEIAPYPVEAIDTVGAGDMYAGAVLYGLTHGLSFAQAGELGSMASAKLVTAYGARMATDELQAVLTTVVGR